FDTSAVNERVAHGVDGLLVPPKGDLAAALRVLYEDADLRCQFGAAARVKAAGQGWEAIFDELEVRYLRLTDVHTRPSDHVTTSMTMAETLQREPCSRASRHNPSAHCWASGVDAMNARI